MNKITVKHIKTVEVTVSSLDINLCKTFETQASGNLVLTAVHAIQIGDALDNQENCTK